MSFGPPNTDNHVRQTSTLASCLPKKSTLDVSWYQKEPRLSLELIHRCGLRSDAAIIDVGGGASLLVDYLCKEGATNVSVLDISGNALASARKMLGDTAKGIEWLEADITEFSPPHPSSLWHDRAAFHFLTDRSDRMKYVKALKQALRPSGHLAIASFAIGGPEKCSDLDIVQYDAPKLMAELGGVFELVEETSQVHITPAEKEQKFRYFRFIFRTPAETVA